MEFDYIIVGAGSAGCLLANRLTESGKHTVCLLEAGPMDRNPFIHIPAGFTKTVLDEKLNWLYTTEPCWGTNGRSIPTPRGRVLGGSSSINGLVYSRGSKEDFNSWAQLGNIGWGYDDLLPCFRKIENYKSTESQYRSKRKKDFLYRGTNGELTITDLLWRDPLCEAFISAAQSFGMPRNEDYNGSTQEGVSYVQRTTRGRFRVSSAGAFLKPIKKRNNLYIKSDVLVTKIIIKNNNAIGVSFKNFSQNGPEKALFSKREVVVSCGAINSPQLLQVSGIGPGNLLKSKGIEVVQHLTGVGENLRDHYATRLTGRAKNVETINELSRGRKLLGQMVKYCLGQRSILELGPTLVYCFWHSNPNVRNNDLQITFTPASYAKGQQAELDKEPGFSITTWPQRPESSGWVRIKSSDPFEKPIIQPNYLSSEQDQRVLLSGIKLSRKIMRSPAMSKFYDYEVYPGDHITSDEDLLSMARDRSTTTYHLIGTCRMAKLQSDASAVVDHKLRVYGISNLRVIDASIMPMMPSANVNAAVMAIAEKGAQLILGVDH
ncbi:MAG: GMC family oxidoreductase N-terminal domain-containing protein [Pseudomonadota bacterium]|nr:GMC family oxidoreductase N-terminal domain-containing protein [Pseudomonadota bacterium]